MSTFDPKISEGNWVAASCFIEGPPEEDRQAIAAIPEMLDVVKAARKIGGRHIDDTLTTAIQELNRAISHLDEKHGSEN